MFDDGRLAFATAMPSSIGQYGCSCFLFLACSPNNQSRLTITGGSWTVKFVALCPPCEISVWSAYPATGRQGRGVSFCFSRLACLSLCGMILVNLWAWVSTCIEWHFSGPVKPLLLVILAQCFDEFWRGGTRLRKTIMYIMEFTAGHLPQVF